MHERSSLANKSVVQSLMGLRNTAMRSLHEIISTLSPLSFPHPLNNERKAVIQALNAYVSYSVNRDQLEQVKHMKHSNMRSTYAIAANVSQFFDTLQD